MKTSLIKIYSHYRFFIIPLFLTFVFGIGVDIKALANEFFCLHNQEKNLLYQLTEKQKILQQLEVLANRLFNSHVNQTNRPLTDRVINSARSNHFKIATVQVALNHGENQKNIYTIKMHLVGTFFDFYHLVQSLSHDSLPLMLKYISLKVQPDGRIDVTVHFIFFSHAFWRVDNATKVDDPYEKKDCLRDPFNEDDQEDTGLLSDQSLHVVSITQMCYLGLFSQEKHVWGLILLPNGDVYDVYPGFYLGKENLRVMRIDSQAVVLLDQHQKPRYLFKC